MWPTEPLVARADDLASVRAALRGSGRCTVTGPGGIGKSALAHSVAASVDRPVRWVDAEPLDSAADLAVAVVRACEGELHPDEDPEASAIAVLDGRADLVVIDGVEHLDGVELLIAGLPTSPDGPWVLVTTRRLGSPSPVHRLGPLDHGGAGGGAAGQLLRSELLARGAAPADDDIGPLAERTGGLPLAIQLMAQRLAAGGPVAAELADRDGSGASAQSLDPVLAASVHRSLDLVSDNASTCFAVLGLTGTAFTPTYVAVLAGDTVDAVSAAVTELTRVGLVMPASGGHDLLPPIRDAAAYHLAERIGEAGLTTAIGGVVPLTANGWESDERAWIVSDNLDNLLHLAWIAVQSVHPDAQRLVNAVFVPVYDQMRNREYLRLASRALELPNPDALLEAGTALRAAIAASECVSISVAWTYLDRAASAWERAGSPAGTGSRIASIRAAFAQDTGDLTAARRLSEQGIELGQRAPDDQFSVWQSRHQLALISLKEGRLDEAEEAATACVEWGRSHDRYIHDNGAIALAWIALERGRTAEAAAQARRQRDDMAQRHQIRAEFVLETHAVELAAEPRFDGPVPEDRRDHAAWLRLTLRLVQSAAAPIEENWEWVLRVAADVVVLADSFPLDYARVMARNLLGDAALAGGELRQAQQSYELAVREAVRSGYRLRAADALDGCAALAVALGDHDAANEATGLADAIRAWSGAHPWPRPSLPSRHMVAADAIVHEGMLRLADVDHLVARLAQATATPIDSDPIWNRLTKSEREIAQRAAAGASNNEIAAELYISRRTVESHLQRVYRKLDVRSRTQLAAMLGAHS